MRVQSLIAVVLGIVLLGAVPARGADDSNLRWKQGRVVDASIVGWPLKKLLGQMAASTGWKVYVEPGIESTINVTFKNLPQGEALRVLLRNVNYALLPGKNGGSELFVYSTSLGGATDLVAPELANKPANWLANEIIVTLAPGAKEDMEKLAESLGGKVVASSEDLNSYRLQFDDAESAQKAREKLAARDDLETSDNYQFDRPENLANAFTGSPASFGIDPAPVGPGEQIKVAVVDTPVQQLEGKMKDFVLPSINIVEGAANLPQEPTHGTSMVQTLLNSMALGDTENVSGTVRILPVDIYGGNAHTTTFEVAMGLRAAIQQNPNIINLSLGGTGYSPLVEQLLEIAYDKQIIVFASAGNTPTTEPTFPAASPYVIGVTASMPDGSIAPYANRGAFVDIKAPGRSMLYYNGQRFISTGTSTATAFASGRAAAYTAQGQPAPEVAAMMLTGFDVKAPVQTGSSAK